MLFDFQEFVAVAVVTRLHSFVTDCSFYRDSNPCASPCVSRRDASPPGPQEPSRQRATESVDDEGGKLAYLFEECQVSKKTKKSKWIFLTVCSLVR